MPYTMEDYRRELAKRHFKDLTPQEQREVIAGLPEAKQRELFAVMEETLKSLPRK